MELFIRIVDGMPFEHPILGDNFRQAFPHIDTNNLPPEFARFERVEMPEVGVYEIYEGTTYEWVDGIVKDVHRVRSMTDEEKALKQDETKRLWANRGLASWIFNEETCWFEPPFPYPDDSKAYVWNEETTSWDAAQEQTE